MVTILMISTKLATLCLLKIKVFWNKGYDVIISVYDVTNKILSHNSNYIVDVVMWLKFGNSSISFPFLYFYFNFNNVGLALGMALKFYTSVAKGLKLKLRKFWCLIPTFVEVTGEKLVWGPLWPSPSWIGLKVKSSVMEFFI